VEGVLGVSGGRRLRLRRPRTRVVMRVVRRKRSRVGAYKVPYTSTNLLDYQAVGMYLT